MVLYADNSKLYRVIKSDDDVAKLQTDLNSLHLWSSRWCMNFNTDKCKAVRLSRKRTVRIINYTLDNKRLECVKSVRDLGTTVYADLRWSQHISEITSKANRTLGLIKRVCRDMRDLDTRKCLYCTLVRPLLEYSSELWSPSENKYKLMLEGVQRRATKFILNYPLDCYKERLTKLNPVPLEYRRDMKDLFFSF